MKKTREELIQEYSKQVTILGDMHMSKEILIDHISAQVGKCRRLAIDLSVMKPEVKDETKPAESI